MKSKTTFKIDPNKHDKAKEMDMGDFYLEMEVARHMLGITEEEFGILGAKLSKDIYDTK